MGCGIRHIKRDLGSALPGCRDARPNRNAVHFARVRVELFFFFPSYRELPLCLQYVKRPPAFHFGWMRLCAEEALLLVFATSYIGIAVAQEVCGNRRLRPDCRLRAFVLRHRTLEFEFRVRVVPLICNPMSDRESASASMHQTFLILPTPHPG